MSELSKKASRRPRRIRCPHCASPKTLQIDDHAGETSFFCMTCEYTWTVTRRDATTGALELLLPRTPERFIAIVGHTASDNRRLEAAVEIAIARATTTVERSRALLGTTTRLLRNTLYRQRRRWLIRRAENAIQ